MPEDKYFLPVEKLSDGVLEYIKQIQGLTEAVKGECLTNDLSHRIHFITELEAMKETAFIKKEEDGLFYIQISENFCQYLWSVGLFQLAYFDNMVQIPMMDRAGTNTHHREANTKDVEFAQDMFLKGRKLLCGFDRDIFLETPNIANPGPYKDIIEHANVIYCAAIAFVYAHEFAHNYLGHTHIENSYQYAVRDEMEADKTAVSFIQEIFETESGFTYKAGVATVLSGLLLMGEDSISGNGTHPDMDVRIETLMNELDLPEMDNLWGYTGCAIRSWLLVYDGITLQEDRSLPEFATYKDFYDFYLSRLKTIRQKRYPQEIPPEWTK